MCPVSDARREAETTARYLLGVADETRLGEFEEELVECIRALLAEPQEPAHAALESALREIAGKAGFADECGRYNEAGDFIECDEQKPRDEWCSVCIPRAALAPAAEEAAKKEVTK